MSVRIFNTQVSTPGRLLDLAQKGVAKMDACKMICLDEADKLLSPEFQPLIEQLIELSPRQLKQDEQSLIISFLKIFLKQV